jgi:hypothetical protein
MGGKLTSIFVIAALAAIPSVAVGAKPPKPKPPNNNLTIKASAATVNFGRTVTLSGVAKNMAAGTVVEIQENPYPYAAFKTTTKSGVVDPQGNWSVSGIQPKSHTQYRAIAKTSPPTESGTAFVRVTISAKFNVSDTTPKRGTKVRFSGTAAPAHDGATVQIQKRTVSGYKTVTTTKLLDNGTANSKYSKRLKISRNGTYRVVVISGDSDHDNGTSRTRTLRVH